MIEKKTTRHKLNHKKKKEKTRWQSNGCSQEGKFHYLATQVKKTC